MKRLLALDLDGTLVRTDGTIAPEDRDAIAQAMADGIYVTIATGRIASGAQHLARELGIELPIICGDGAQLVNPWTGTLIDHASVDARARELALAVFTAHELAPFTLTHERAHGARRDAHFTPYVRGFTSLITLDDPVSGATPIAMVLGLGPRDRAERARGDLAGLTGTRSEAFSIGDPWVVRVRSIRSTKGRALADLAAELGVDRENVAFAGDYYNDLSAFDWVGRSFAMGQAPSDVRARASDVLEATSTTGGAVVELLARWKRTDLG